MKRFKAVLFDYDGTLIDTNGIVINSWQHTAEVTMKGKHFDLKDITSSFGIPLEAGMELMSKKYGLSDYSIEKLCEIYREYQLNHEELLGDAYEGIKECLIRLKEEDYLVGIVTSRINSSTIMGLKRNNIDMYFDCILGADDTNIHKPDPAPCLLACEKLLVDPKDAIMLGDSIFDIECANRAGARSVFVNWSVCTKLSDFSENNKPDYVIEKPLDIFDIL